MTIAGKKRSELERELEYHRRRVRELEEQLRTILAAPDEEPSMNGLGDEFESLSGSETILLVDDDKHVRAAVRRMIELYGYRVVAAGDVEEALALLEAPEASVDLILTDIMMPGRSGYDLVRRAQKIKPDTAVLFMTGYAEGDVVPKEVYDVLASGVDFIEKPFTRQELALRIRQRLHPAAQADR